MYIKKSELDALGEAADFISSNSDLAEDREYYDGLVRALYNLERKGRKQYWKQRRKKKKKVNTNHLTGND